MPLDDENVEQQQPTEQPAHPAPVEPQQPQYDIETAYSVIAEHEGWDPRLTRYQMDELKRRTEELHKREREFEAERQRQWQPPEETGDPYMQRIGRLERLLLEDRERNRKREEEQERAARVGNELHSAYTQMARQTGLTREQMEQRSTEFYDVLADLYPDPEMVQRIGADRAVRAAFRVFSASNGHRPPQPNVQGRGPTATRVIPGSPQPFVNGNPLPPEDSLSAEQLPGETDEQYEARLRRIIEGVGLKRLPDGTRVSSR